MNDVLTVIFMVGLTTWVGSFFVLLIGLFFTNGYENTDKLTEVWAGIGAASMALGIFVLVGAAIVGDLTGTM